MYHSCVIVYEPVTSKKGIVVVSHGGVMVVRRYVGVFCVFGAISWVPNTMTTRESVPNTTCGQNLRWIC
jgi:hypothetical protein